MTTDKAFEMVAKYGNVHKDIEVLKKEKPSIFQLSQVQEILLLNKNLSTEEIVEILKLIQQYFKDKENVDKGR